MGIVKWIGNIFTKSEKDDVSHQIEPSTSTSSNTPIKTKKDIAKEIINESQLAIKKLNQLVNLAEGSIYHVTLEKILEFSSDIHDKIIIDEKIHINKLRNFTKYKTLEFVKTFDLLLDPLRPKIVIPEHLKSDFRIDEDEEEEITIEEPVVIVEEIPVVVPVTDFEVSKRNIEKYLEDNSVSALLDNTIYDVSFISDLKILLSYSIYEYIKSSENISYSIKTNKEVDMNDSSLIESYVTFLAKNSNIKQKSTIYIATSSTNNDSPVLYDLSTNKVYLYSYLTKERIDESEISDDYIIFVSDVIRYNNFNK